MFSWFVQVDPLNVRKDEDTWMVRLNLSFLLLAARQRVESSRTTSAIFFIAGCGVIWTYRNFTPPAAVIAR
jgi:hypothetical protein